MVKLYSAKVKDVGKEVEVAPEVEKVKKEKKPRTEKQIAAFNSMLEKKAAKAQAEVAEAMPAAVKKARKRKPAKVEVVPELKEEEEAGGAEEAEEAKPKAKRQKKQKAVEPATPPPSLSEEGVLQNGKIVMDDGEVLDPVKPPKWFVSYVRGVKEEEELQKASNVGQKKIKAQAAEKAQTEWSDPKVRHRVETSVNDHMHRMYNAIFPNRKFK